MAKNPNLSGNLFTKQPLRERETSISKTIEDYLNVKKIFNIRVQSGAIQTKSGHWMRFAKKGTPDRLAILAGLAIFIEVKRIGEKPTPEQIAVHEDLRANGAIVIVAQRLEDVQTVIEKITQRVKI
jgi:hypothetical protein